jgi:hypothetical protein
MVTVSSGIVEQPAPHTVVSCLVRDTLSVRIPATVNTVEYRWYQCDDANKNNPQPVSATPENRFPIPATLAPGVYYYYCTVALDSCSLFESDVAEVTAPAYLDARFTGTPSAIYDDAGDSLVVTLKAANAGNNILTAPFYISAYKDAVSATAMATDSSLTALNAGATQSVSVTVRNFSSYTPLTGLVFRINDRGAAQFVQPECNVDNNTLFLPFASLLLAHSDSVSTISGIETLIPILQNDSIPSGCCTPVPEITVVAHGSATVSDDTVHYVSAPGFAGYDTLTYRLVCGSYSSTAQVYIYVAEMPDNVSEAECYIEPVPMDWDMQEAGSGISQTSTWLYQPPITGDIDGDNITEIIVSNAALNGLVIYKGNNLSVPFTTFGITGTIPNIGFGLGAVRTKISESESRTFIIIHTLDGYLRAYRTNGAWAWNSIAAHFASMAPVTFGFADFNHDGYAEIYMGNRIFDAATGVLLCQGAGNAGYSAIWQTNPSYVTAVGDVLGNGELQLVAGNQVYEVNITDRTGTANNSMTAVKELPAFTMENGSTAPADGTTVLADINCDGRLDVIVRRCTFTAGSDMQIYVWTPSLDAGGRLLAQKIIPGVIKSGLPMVGDIDGDKYPEIVLMGGINTTDTYNVNDSIYALKYVSGSNVLVTKWGLNHRDASGFTGLTLFDFNQDGISELVYRDNYNMRIINGSLKSHLTGNDTTVYDLSPPVACQSGTAAEYPVVADIDGDGHAEIITAGPPTDNTQPPWIETGQLRVFRGSAQNPWAPARSVWNQAAFNPVHINDDLTVPAWPVNPATFFSGDGNSNGIQPYNNFMQQQTTLNRNGVAVWITPNAVFDPAQTYAIRDGDSVAIHVCITNNGDAPIGKPVYFSLYRDDVDDPDNYLTTDSIDVLLQPGEGACIDIGIPDVNPKLPFVELVVRLNDRNGVYPYQQECDCGDSIQARFNPARDLMMKKDATLNGSPVKLNGRYSNPVSVLFGDTIHYKITGIFVDTAKGYMIIRDTLPPYMKYTDYIAFNFPLADVTVHKDQTVDIPSRDYIHWTFGNLLDSLLNPLDTIIAEYKATPESGAVASQPLFINYAHVDATASAGDTVFSVTNSTYHQGAGVSIVTFSASVGGKLFNAREQALDYRTSPRAGVLIVPDSGYMFAGWSHGEYISLRGETVPADSGIMNYGDIVIYGNVELHAHFVPEAGKPKKDIIQEAVVDNSDKVWAHDRDIYIRTRKDVLVRIYSTEGVLQRQFTITDDGTTTVRMERGIYIVTMDDGTGWKVACG